MDGRTAGELWSRDGIGEIKTNKSRIGVCRDVLEVGTIQIRTDQDAELELERNSRVKEVANNSYILQNPFVRGRFITNENIIPETFVERNREFRFSHE